MNLKSIEDTKDYYFSQEYVICFVMQNPEGADDVFDLYPFYLFIIFISFFFFFFFFFFLIF